MRIPVASGSGSLDANVINHRDKGNCADGKPDPLARSMAGIGAKDTGSKHDVVCSNSCEKRCAREAGDERQTGKDQGIRDEPVDVAQPEDLAEDMLVGVANMLVDVPKRVMLPV